MPTQLKYRICNPEYCLFIIESSKDGVKWERREGPGSMYSNWRSGFSTLSSAEYALSFIRLGDDALAKMEYDKRNFVPMEPKYY